MYHIRTTKIYLKECLVINLKRTGQERNQTEKEADFERRKPNELRLS